MVRCMPILILFAALAGCQPDDSPVGPGGGPAGRPAGERPPSGVASAAPVALSLTLSTPPEFGRVSMLMVRTVDSAGRFWPTLSATAHSDSRASVVVELAGERSMEMGGRQLPTRMFMLRAVAAGRTVVMVENGQLKDSLILDVPQVSPRSTALVVDTFAVVSVPLCDANVCSDDYPPVAFAPVLRVHAEPGAAGVRVIGVEVSMPATSTGYCAGDVIVDPGAARDLGYYDPARAGTLTMIEPWGIPPEAGTRPIATARVLVQEAGGARAWVTAATAMLADGMSAKDIPVATSTSPRWACGVK